MTSQSDFISIKPLFRSDFDRNLIYLQAIYHNYALLFQEIGYLLKKHLSEELLQNKKVLLKPNWVRHDIRNTDSISMRTNDNFLLATLEIILSFKPAAVTIGDAPIQGCIWEKVVNETFAGKIEKLSEKFNIPVVIKDFRRVTFIPDENNLQKERKPLSDYVIFNLGKESFLEPITRADKNLFRVNDYDPDRLAEMHQPGIHKYCITKELFDSDIVISLPKIKTHQKAGLTGAIKNIVGLNGDKDYLPHHRIGGTAQGGDCYPGIHPLRYLAELTLDKANKSQGKILYPLLKKMVSLLWRLSVPRKEESLSAAWHGNDTTWRMVMDLNKIITFGKVDGTIENKPQRTLFSLCDGIIGGQGDGPLRPEPLPLGIISFTNHSFVNDVAMALLMNFDYWKIPLLKTAYTNSLHETVRIEWDDKPIGLHELSRHAINAIPPPGWINHI